MTTPAGACFRRALVRRRITPAPTAALQRWLHSWPGLGAIIVGMSAQGFDVELRQFPGAWRATFFPAGLAHSIVPGTANEPRPWRAVERAAWVALGRE